MNYKDSYDNLTNIADQIVQGTYQRKEREVPKLINRPQKQDTMIRGEQESDDAWKKDYMAAIKVQNAQLKAQLQGLGSFKEAYQGAGSSRSRANMKSAPNIPTGSNAMNMPIKEMESYIRQQALARGIDPDVAVNVFRHEGGGHYQSNVIMRGGNRERSYGPFQLYIDGGLGNEYQEKYGVDLREDNTPEGLRRQVDFSLDKVLEQGWTPWYGAKAAGYSKWTGIRRPQR